LTSAQLPQLVRDLLRTPTLGQQPPNDLSQRHVDRDELRSGISDPPAIRHRFPVFPLIPTSLQASALVTPCAINRTDCCWYFSACTRPFGARRLFGIATANSVGVATFAGIGFLNSQRVSPTGGHGTTGGRWSWSGAD
jgi:hypothetical protein